MEGVTHPLAVGLHVAALKGAAQRVSVQLLKQGTATTEDYVLSTPAFITELLQNLQRAEDGSKKAETQLLDFRCWFSVSPSHD